MFDDLVVFGAVEVDKPAGRALNGAARGDEDEIFLSEEQLDLIDASRQLSPSCSRFHMGCGLVRIRPALDNRPALEPEDVEEYVLSKDTALCLREDTRASWKLRITRIR